MAEARLNDTEGRNLTKPEPIEDDGQIVILVSFEEDEFIIPRNAADLSVVVKNMTEEWDDDFDPTEAKLPLVKIQSATLVKVIEFLKHYVDDPMTPIAKPIRSNRMSEICTEQWYANYVDNMEKSMLYNVVLAANFMDIEPLLNLTCCKISTYLYGKKKHEIPGVFGVSGDFTPEDEMNVYTNHPWVADLKIKADPDSNVAKELIRKKDENNEIKEL